MKYLFVPELFLPEDVGFSLYGPEHLIWLGVLGVMCGAMVVSYRAMSPAARTRFARITATGLLALEVLRDVYLVAAGAWKWSYLPLHLCSINIFVCLAYTLTKKDLLAEFLYSLCLPGAVVALIVPTWNDLPILNGMHLHSASVHIMLVMYPVLVLANGFRPSFRRLPKILCMLAAVAVPIYFVNKWLGTNFFFLARTENNPVLEMLAAVFGEKYFFLGLPLLLIIVWTLMYIPWALAARKKAKA